MRTGKMMVFTKSGQKLVEQERTVPVLKAGEILVKNLYTTICGSDLHTFCGLRHEKTPTVLGHEIVGEIVGIDENHSGYDHGGNRLALGDIVTWAVFCAEPQQKWIEKEIPQKSAGLFKYGHAKVTESDAFHGGLAEYCILKNHSITLKVPNSLPLSIAATINCSLATVAGTLRLAGNLKGKNILITGMGLLGNSCAAMCKEEGANLVWGIDISRERLTQSLSFGVDHTLLMNKNADELLAKIKTEVPNGGFDVVFDMSGSPDAIELGLEALTIGGIAVWAGAVFKTREIQVDAEKIIRSLITIKGLHNYNYDDFLYALHFISQHHNTYPFNTVVGKEFPLEQAQEAFEYALKHQPLRVGISFKLR